MLTKKGSKLAREILGIIGISCMVSVFFFGIMQTATQALVEIYCENTNLVLNEVQSEEVYYWLRTASRVAAVILFLVLYLVLTGQRLIYIRKIIQGIETLQQNNLDVEVPVEGDDELSQLAESINYLVKSQRQLKEKEEALSQEKDAFIRALSHDIRTPLTSVLAMSEYLDEKESLSPEETKDFISLVKTKSAQMKILTDRLLNEGQRNAVYVENGRLLFEQLCDEWQELLEDTFECLVMMEECPAFSGEFDVAELRRIFDNLASNIQKYADPEEKVELKVTVEDTMVVILQSNMIASKKTVQAESYGIGLQSIERLAKIYHGAMNVQISEQKYVIEIRLKL